MTNCKYCGLKLVWNVKEKKFYEENGQLHDYETRCKPNQKKGFEFIVLDQATQEMIQYLTRKHIEIKYLVQQVIKREHVQFDNQQSVNEIIQSVKEDLARVTKNT